MTTRHFILCGAVTGGKWLPMVAFVLGWRDDDTHSFFGTVNNHLWVELRFIAHCTLSQHQKSECKPNSHKDQSLQHLPFAFCNLFASHSSFTWDRQHHCKRYCPPVSIIPAILTILFVQQSSLFLPPPSKLFEACSPPLDTTAIRFTTKGIALLVGVMTVFASQQHECKSVSSDQEQEHTSHPPVDAGILFPQNEENASPGFMINDNIP